MSLPLLASLLLVAAQDRLTTQSEEPVAPGDRPPATGTPAPAAPPEAEAQEPEAGRSEEVCRRVAVYDDFGRQRSRRVCRPR
ncbi:hypothetical protein [Sphingosinicella terrae]|uniref:hypothetical protein n=1 Tax=Sphingosinicella terrae TaxID=2172047 RepID=UPI000E0CE1AC|nr:hypothetical protein [Sphingosinicella terrae]